MLEFDIEKVRDYEKKIGKTYSWWSVTDKINFLMLDKVKELDNFVKENTLPLPNQFEREMFEIMKLGFEVAYVGKYSDRYERNNQKEVILYNPENGLFYHACSITEGIKLEEHQEIGSSCLYCEFNGFKPTASKELRNYVLNQGSGDRRSRSYAGVGSRTIEMLIDGCEFQNPWTKIPYLLWFINPEEEKNKDDRLDYFDDIVMEKISKMPTEAQKILGYTYKKTL